MTRITVHLLRDALAARVPLRIDEPLAAQAGVALLVVPAPPDDLDILFIRRAEMEGDPWSGHMALPGGRRHPNDKDLRETAERETREETGIDLSPVAFLAHLDDVRPRSRALAPIVVRPHLFGLEHRPRLILSSEVADSLWVPVNALRRAHGETTVDVRGTLLRVPAFSIGSNIIWGLTERIVSGFMELLDKI